jgi:ribonuclease BN (tRNA processing enzyme)
VRITVLGRSPSWSDAAGACSGYLVEEGDTRLLLDCGNGVFPKLRARCDYLDVTAVVLSHLHADHFLDLVPFAYALTYGPRQGPDPVRPVLHAPAGAVETFRRVVGAWGNEDLIESAFEVVEYETTDTPRVGPLQLRMREVPHFIRTHAIEVRGGDGGRFTFGADCGPNEAIIELATGTDLLFLEATITEPEAKGPRGHLMPTEAGEHARRAGARRLVLTHISDELDLEAARREAEGSFGGPVEIAAEGATYTV